MNCFSSDILQRFLFCCQEEKEKMNIGIVGSDRVFCKALLGNQVMEKDLFCRNELLWEGFSSDGRVE